MAIIIKTTRPNALLKTIRDGIEDGTIRTWEEDEEGDFTHITSDGQWYNKAWFRPFVKRGEIRFGLIGRERYNMTRSIYAVYHGRFTQMLLEHCHEFYNYVTSSSEKEPEDLFDWNEE